MVNKVPVAVVPRTHNEELHRRAAAHLAVWLIAKGLEIMFKRF